jgi:undecaprenyl diphosphate synthase
MEATRYNSKMQLTLALSYSGRWEILEAIKQLVRKAAEGNLDVSEIDENIVTSHLQTKGMPEPELLIRTSGEMRISNFLLWQVAYTELFFTDVLWPDFRKEHLYQAILAYQSRERRFGRISEQVNS